MTELNQLAHYLSTRLCHDLTGPISAINNGAELLEDEGFDMQADAMELILASAREASARIRFYRLAYGHVPEAGEYSLREKQEVVNGFYESTRISVDWSAVGDVPVSQAISRIMLNMLIVAGGALIRGGTLTMTQSESNITILAQGASVKMDEEKLAIITAKQSIDEMDPKLAQLYLLQLMCAHLQADITADYQADESLKLTLSY